ncbi:MAG: family 10 glycosylhydrolase, partial [Myxococcota bacterium]
MSERRLLFYNDARHYHLYCYEPPISIEDARAPVDEIAGTKVDTFVYGFGAGPTMFHLTEVGEVFASHVKAFRDIPGVHRGTLPTWRAHENIMSLKERGVDLLHLLIDRAHEKGLVFYASLRQTHSCASDDVDNYFNWQFKIDHPEWCLQGRGKHAFNFAYPEVRAERFALAEETVNRYEVDGFEIDWAFWPYFFEEDEVEQNTPILTEYMREHRCVIEHAAAKRGRRIVFGARVLPTLQANLDVGLDVASWMEEGLLDFVVPNFYVDEQMDADFPFEWLVEGARGTRCKVFPALQRHVGRPREP